jgi:hypothetical protein
MSGSPRRDLRTEETEQECRTRLSGPSRQTPTRHSRGEQTADSSFVSAAYDFNCLKDLFRPTAKCRPVQMLAAAAQSGISVHFWVKGLLCALLDPIHSNI